MKYTIYLLFGLLTFTHIALAQEEISEEEKEKKEEEKLQITGSVDVYYKYDFSGYVDSDGTSNIGTSFADNQNSISVGMLDVGLSKTVGKATFVGEFSFGPRSFKSIPTFQAGTGDQTNINLQNIYVSYALTEKLSVTAGYMGTFVGYEVIAPTGNFNYSTSYLFSFGPFQNAGLKFDYAISDNFAIMAGVFNDWNVYQDFNGVSDFGAQLFWAPTDGWDVYLNFLTGSPSGTIIDLTTGYQMSDKFYLGLNAADYSFTGDTGGYYGIALYPQISLSESFSLGWRPEFFTFKEQTDESGATISDAEDVFANTITGNFYYGPLTISTEYRIDGASSDFFYDSETMPTNTAQQFLIAAIFAF